MTPPITSQRIVELDHRFGALALAGLELARGGEAGEDRLGPLPHAKGAVVDPRVEVGRQRSDPDRNTR